MPVERTIVLKYVLKKFFVDMDLVEAKATLLRLLDDVPAGETEFTIPTAHLVGIIGVPGVAGKSRGDDITDSVYEYAIAQGHISGTIE